MLCFVLGTRPEIIKMAPLLRRCVERTIDFRLIHTGQHYDPLLDGLFFRELELPAPNVQLQSAGKSSKEFFENLLPALEKALSDIKPSCVIVQGDTNSAYGGALAAHTLGIPVAHVEAGLRSDDLSMPEEVNRIKIDGMAQRLYVPTEHQAERARREGIDAARILVAGNTVADAVSEHLVEAHARPWESVLAPLVSGPYAIITLHRPALVDQPERLLSVLHGIHDVLVAHGLTAVFPVHPRTRKMITDLSLFDRMTMIEPVGYFSMLKLLSGTRLLVTDSGGLQEEAAIVRVPCITVRENTERPETFDAGGNRVTGFDVDVIRAAADELLGSKIPWKPVYAVDHPSDTILEDLLSRYA